MKDIREKVKKLRKKLAKLEKQIEDKDKIVYLTNLNVFHGAVNSTIEVEFLLFNKYKCNIDLYNKTMVNETEIQDSLIEMIKKDVKDLHIN